MSWYQYIFPVVLIGLAVRVEALFIGPYWAWLELISELGGDEPRKRRLALVRRVAIPGIICFLLNLLWSATYSEWSAVTIGASAASLLLWPVVVTGLPWQVRTRDRTTILLYGSLVVAFASASWVGAKCAIWINESYGSLWSFIRQEIPSLVIGSVLTAFAVGVFDRASSSASNR